jgi:hypothetical protein
LICETVSAEDEKTIPGSVTAGVLSGTPTTSVSPVGPSRSSSAQASVAIRATPSEAVRDHPRRRFDLS